VKLINHMNIRYILILMRDSKSSSLNFLHTFAEHYLELENDVRPFVTHRLACGLTRLYYSSSCVVQMVDRVRMDFTPPDLRRRI
jgi:hypothetical protein